MFDSAWAVVWGGQVLDGHIPDYGVDGAPTPHPLATLFGTVAALGGDSAYVVLSAIAVTALAALVVLVYLLGRETGGSWRPGLIAALVVATSYTVLAGTITSGFDVMATALVVAAALLEVRRARCGAPVLVLLAVAGLQRPEAWLLSGAYWLYLAPPLDWARRLRLAALAAAGPALWMTADLVVTGDPLYSFLHTSESFGVHVAAVGQHAAASKPGPGEVTNVTTDSLRTILRMPILLGSLLGLAISTVGLRSRVRALAVVFAIWVVAFMGLGLAGLPMANRFLLAPAAMLAVFYAVGAVGWIDRPATPRGAGAERWILAAWPAGGLLLLAALLATVPSQANGIADLRARVSLNRHGISDLRALRRGHPGASVLDGCPRIYVTSNEVVPLLSHAIDRPPNQIAVLARGERSSTGAFLTPTRRLVRADAFSLRRPHGVTRLPSDFSVVAANASWSLSAKGCG